MAFRLALGCFSCSFSLDLRNWLNVWGLIGSVRPGGGGNCTLFRSGGQNSILPNLTGLAFLGGLGPKGLMLVFSRFLTPPSTDQ